MRIKRVVLKHHGDVPVLGRNIVDDIATDHDFAAGDVFKAGDHAQRRGFAAARRSDKNHEFVVGNIQIDTANSLDLIVALNDFP